MICPIMSRGMLFRSMAEHVPDEYREIKGFVYCQGDACAMWRRYWHKDEKTFVEYCGLAGEANHKG